MPVETNPSPSAATTKAIVPTAQPAVGGDFMVKVTNIIYKLESSLYSLYLIFSAPVYTSLTEKLPTPVKNVLNKIGNILNGIVEQIRSALNSTYMEQGLAIMEAADQLLDAAEGLVPESVAETTAKVRKFMQLIVGLARLGKVHVDAVLDLFSAVVSCALGNLDNKEASTLDETTTKTLEPALAVYPVPASVKKLAEAKDVTTLEKPSLVLPAGTTTGTTTGTTALATAGTTKV